MDSSHYQYIRFAQEGAKAFITFNRPEVLNALNRPLIEEAVDAFEKLPRETRVLVIRGTGERAFAAGADLTELDQRTLWSELEYGPRRKLAHLLEGAPFPTVAALNGLALGGGLELALACHLRIASENARLGLPELRLGVIPGNGGTARLPRLVGRGRALQALLLSEQLKAHEAERFGLINWVVAADEFDQKVSALADQLAKLPPIATRALLDCVIRGSEMSLEDAIEREQRWFQICLSSADKQEGVAAFREKRAAHFKGLP
jgi:enoyl-CoA hydratase